MSATDSGNCICKKMALKTPVISIFFFVELNTIFDSFQILAFTTGNGLDSCNSLYPQEMRAGHINHCVVKYLKVC